MLSLDLKVPWLKLLLFYTPFFKVKSLLALSTFSFWSGLTRSNEEPPQFFPLGSPIS